MRTIENRGSGSCPTFFQLLCRNAHTPGSGGYAAAGYQLAGHLPGLSPDWMEDEEWASGPLADLLTAVCPGEPGGLVQPPNNRAVLAWFDRWLPRCMDLVPRHHRGSFLKGLYQAVIEEEQDCFTL